MLARLVAQNIAFYVIAAADGRSAAIRVVTTQEHRARRPLPGARARPASPPSTSCWPPSSSAITQVLVYIGAIVVLFLFGIMLTRAPTGADADLDNDQRQAGRRGGRRRAAARRHGLRPLGPVPTTSEFGHARHGAAHRRRSADSIFSTYLVPFEVVSVLLLAALIGAIVLARRD